MSRASTVFLAVAGLSLAACDVKVNDPNPSTVVVEKKPDTVIIEKEKPGVDVNVDIKDR